MRRKISAVSSFSAKTSISKPVNINPNIFLMLFFICINCRTEMNASNYQTFVESEWSALILQVSLTRCLFPHRTIFFLSFIHSSSCLSTILTSRSLFFPTDKKKKSLCTAALISSFHSLDSLWSWLHRGLQMPGSVWERCSDGLVRSRLLLQPGAAGVPGLLRLRRRAYHCSLHRRCWLRLRPVFREPLLPVLEGQRCGSPSSDFWRPHLPRASTKHPRQRDDGSAVQRGGAGDVPAARPGVVGSQLCDKTQLQELPSGGDEAQWEPGGGGPGPQWRSHRTARWEVLSGRQRQQRRRGGAQPHLNSAAEEPKSTLQPQQGYSCLRCHHSLFQPALVVSWYRCRSYDGPVVPVGALPDQLPPNFPHDLRVRPIYDHSKPR